MANLPNPYSAAPVIPAVLPVVVAPPMPAWNNPRVPTAPQGLPQAIGDDYAHVAYRISGSILPWGEPVKPRFVKELERDVSRGTAVPYLKDLDQTTITYTTAQHTAGYMLSLGVAQRGELLNMLLTFRPHSIPVISHASVMLGRTLRHRISCRAGGITKPPLGGIGPICRPSYGRALAVSTSGIVIG